MRKLSLILIVVILLFSGCGAKEAELSDISYDRQILEDEQGYYFVITPKADINNFEINFAFLLDNLLLESYEYKTPKVKKGEAHRVDVVNPTFTSYDSRSGYKTQKANNISIHEIKGTIN